MPAEAHSNLKGPISSSGSTTMCLKCFFSSLVVALMSQNDSELSSKVFYGENTNQISVCFRFTNK